MHLPYNSVIPQLDIDPSEINFMLTCKPVHRKLYAQCQKPGTIQISPQEEVDKQTVVHPGRTEYLAIKKKQVTHTYNMDESQMQY